MSPVLQLSIEGLAPRGPHPTLATVRREAVPVAARARLIGPISPNCVQDLVLATSGGGRHGDK